VHAATLAIEKYNSSHTDSQIELIVEDGKCNGADATSAAQKLITVDKVPVML
jgi:ABC-type branched-subunit amino acid transport system substrate-binding protein